MPKPLRALRAASSLALVALMTTSAGAQQVSSNLLILDQDAHAVSDTQAGALFNRGGLASPGVIDPTVLPALEIAADTGAAAFEFVSGLAISPVDGSAWISDLGLDFGAADDGAIFRHDAGSGTIATVSGRGTPQLRDPFALAFHDDGRLFVADWEADPSGFGSDFVGGIGHGAIFEVDTSTGALTLVSDGTNHDVPGLDPTESAFQDPIGVAWDPVNELLYVADFSADGDNDGFFNGTIFSLNLDTGALRVVSAYWNFAAPTGVVVRPNGRPLVVDAVQDDSVLFEIDLAQPDVTDNVSFITSGTQYSLLEGATVDAADNVYVVDIGEFDDVDGVFVVEPGAYRVDESQRGIDPDFDLNNQVPVVSWVDGEDTILSPVNLTVVPVPEVTAISPRSVTAATAVTVEGRHLHPNVGFDFDGAITVSAVAFEPGRLLGTSLTMTLTPTGAGTDCSPPLTTAHPFGGGATFADAISLASDPGPPFSVFGDANRDGIVDGLDLGIIGRIWGVGVCETALFQNDADFNNDDLIDGLDLTILMTYFGVRP